MEVKRSAGDMEPKRCSGKKREGSGMELKPCWGLPGKEKERKRKRKRKKKTKKRRSLFYVFKSRNDYCIYMIDVKSHFLPGTDATNYSGRSKATRIDGHDCPPPWMPNPYMYFQTTGKPGELPDDPAVVALGSKIYLIGGHCNATLPRDVYVIDTAEEFPEITKMSSVLHWGKRQPIAWTIGGNIYVLPHTLLEVVLCEGRMDMGQDLHNGKLFERYNPVSDSWTVLPSPNIGEIRQDDDSDFFVVTSHAVLGSKLLISVGSFVLAFDTAQPDRGWTEIELSLEHGPHSNLNVLPTDPCYSSPLGDNLVLCYPRVCLGKPHRLSALLKEELDMDCDNGYYVCRFHDFDENGHLKASIVPFDGSSLGMRWAKFFHPRNDLSTLVTRFSDDLVLVAKVGRDYDRLGLSYRLDHNLPDKDIGDPYLSFELFRVSETHPDAEFQYQASGTCSALFKVDQHLAAHLELFRCFVMEDGLFR